MVALAVLATIAVIGLMRWRRLWSGEDLVRLDAGTRTWWLGSEALRRGFVRGVPLSVVGCWALVIALAALWIEDRSRTRGGLPARVSAGAFVALCVVALLSASVTLFNRPKWVVPPPYRHEQGAVAMWARRFRGR